MVINKQMQSEAVTPADQSLPVLTQNQVSRARGRQFSSAIKEKEQPPLQKVKDVVENPATGGSKYDSSL
jgi:hypothetical protein